MSDIVPRVTTSCRLYPQPNGPLVQTPCSWDVTTRDGKALLIACSNPGDIDFGPDGCARIVAVKWCIFAESRPNPESGEVDWFARTVLIDRQGRTFRTSSAHAPHTMARIVEMFTPEEWAVGIPIVVRERMSRKTKRTYHDIRVEWEGTGNDGP